jgi:hypothetical protein
MAQMSCVMRCLLMESSHSSLEVVRMKMFSLDLVVRSHEEE